MTSNPKESTTMGPLQERHQTSALSRRSCLVTSQSRLTSRMRRRPARRALFELSHNDRRIERRRNFAFAENLLTIPVAEFKKKWNFDPVKMKPTNQIMSDNSIVSPDKMHTDKDDETNIPRYEWRLMNENTEKKNLEKTLCSLAPNSARSMRLSYLASRNNIQNETSLLEEDNNNSTYVHDSNLLNNEEISESSYESNNSSIEFNSTNTSFESQSSAEKLSESVSLTENILDSSVEKPLEALPVENPLESSAGKPLAAVKPGDTENKEGVQKSISVVTNHKDSSSSSFSTASIDPVPTECIPVQAQFKNTKGEKNTKQLKITDFACQRKRVHSDSAVPEYNPTKRLRPLL
ncbi:hypothetical protein FHG87_002805 [Trinorchestia longiramus]|nr:hypothetical protein FHG87_002805 [Trinorchestia longiramus]